MSDRAPPQRNEAQPRPAKTARGAPITTLLIAVNVVIFVLEEAWGGSTRGETLMRMGAVFGDRQSTPRWETLLSYAYLHIGTLHIGMNMLGLWSVGRALEPMLGGARFFGLYTLSAIGGGVAISLSPTPHLTAGASGALFGLLGAVCALLIRRYRQAFFEQERHEIRSMLGQILVPNLLISFLPGVSFLGHAGGLTVGGLFMARILVKRKSPRSPPPAADKSPLWTAMALLLFVITVTCIARIWLTYEPWKS